MWQNSAIPCGLVLNSSECFLNFKLIYLRYEYKVDFNSKLEIIAASEDMRIVSARRKYEVYTCFQSGSSCSLLLMKL
jgi:hypothetical protein